MLSVVYTSYMSSPPPLSLSHSAGHPNIVMLKDVCESTESLYIVQELCDGGSLMDFMMKVGTGREMIVKVPVPKRQVSVPATVSEPHGLHDEGGGGGGGRGQAAARYGRHVGQGLFVGTHAPLYDA